MNQNPDAYSSRASNANDITVLVDALLGTIKLPEYSTDIDRSVVWTMVLRCITNNTIKNEGS